MGSTHYGPEVDVFALGITFADMIIKEYMLKSGAAYQTTEDAEMGVLLEAVSYTHLDVYKRQQQQYGQPQQQQQFQQPIPQFQMPQQPVPQQGDGSGVPMLQSGGFQQQPQQQIQ